MSFHPNRLGYESGVTLWWSQYSFASIGVGVVEPAEGAKAVRTVIAGEPTGKSGEAKVSYPLLDKGLTLGSDDVVQFSIETTPSDYKLVLTSGEARARVSFAAETLTISPPVGGAFTGAMFGIYAFGRSEPALDPSDFWDIEIVERSE